MPLNYLSHFMFNLLEIPYIDEEQKVDLGRDIDTALIYTWGS